jgi:hypothetical protein
MCRGKNEENRFRNMYQVRNIIDEILIVQSEKILHTKTGVIRKKIYRTKEKIERRDAMRKKHGVL